LQLREGGGRRGDLHRRVARRSRRGLGLRCPRIWGLAAVGVHLAEQMSRALTTFGSAMPKTTSSFFKRWANRASRSAAQRAEQSGICVVCAKPPAILPLSSDRSATVVTALSVTALNSFFSHHRLIFLPHSCSRAAAVAMVSRNSATWMAAVGCRPSAEKDPGGTAAAP
jgi:hypothetical protein